MHHTSAVPNFHRTRCSWNDLPTFCSLVFRWKSGDFICRFCCFKMSPSINHYILMGKQKIETQLIWPSILKYIFTDINNEEIMNTYCRDLSKVIQDKQGMNVCVLKTERAIQHLYCWGVKVSLHIIRRFLAENYSNFTITKPSLRIIPTS